ncbi:MAG: hypothetical protein JWL67_16 [Solirubrobacterales bacterium]|nr:hypothetical protein [Solirubrobacterales bacterium]
MLRLVTLAATVALAAAIFLSTCEATPERPFQLGLVSNADAGARAARIGALGASIVRVEFPIDATPVRLGRVIARFARHGVSVLPLAGFHGRVPTIAEARNLATWARAFGPSGTFWRHRPGGALAIRNIEFGNETNQGGQFEGCGYSCPAFAQRARAYALALKAAQEAIAGPLGNPAVGLLAIGDDGGTGSPNWVNDIFSAVPDLAHRITGWTAHPYGMHWWRVLDRLVSQTAARGAPSSIPIYITEVGVASDNGRCLSNNFGWNPCMSYAEAGSAIQSVISGIRSRYGARVRAVFVFQAFDQRRPESDSDREHYFGALTSTGGSKGAYTSTLSSLLRTLH